MFILTARSGRIRVGLLIGGSGTGVDPAQRARIADIRDNLTARVREAEREGWHGEIEGLQISLAGAEDKLAQLDTRTANTTTYLDMPARKHTGEHLNV